MDEAKLRKKRERNRLAATKCRQRKLEKINNLGNMRKTSQIVQLSKDLIHCPFLFQRAKWLGYARRMRISSVSVQALPSNCLR